MSFALKAIKTTPLQEKKLIRKQKKKKRRQTKKRYTYIQDRTWSVETDVSIKVQPKDTTKKSNNKSFTSQREINTLKIKKNILRNWYYDVVKELVVAGDIYTSDDGFCWLVKWWKSIRRWQAMCQALHGDLS